MHLHLVLGTATEIHATSHLEISVMNHHDSDETHETAPSAHHPTMRLHSEEALVVDVEVNQVFVAAEVVVADFLMTAICFREIVRGIVHHHSTAETIDRQTDVTNDPMHDEKILAGPNEIVNEISIVREETLHDQSHDPSTLVLLPLRLSIQIAWH